jgi:hypothetical protein
MKMIQKEFADVVLIVSSLVFTVLGNVFIWQINSLRMLKHSQDEKLLAEMLELVRSSNAGKGRKKKTAADHGLIELVEPRLIPLFNFWIVLLINIAAYVFLSTTL